MSYNKNNNNNNRIISTGVLNASALALATQLLLHTEHLKYLYTGSLKKKIKYSLGSINTTLNRN